MQNILNIAGNGGGKQPVNQNLQGCLSQIDESIKISLAGLSEKIKDMNSSIDSNSTTISKLNKSIPDGLNKIYDTLSGTSGIDLLWSSSTSLTPGNSCTLSKDLNSYRFVAFRSGLVYPFSLVKYISATATYTNGVDTIDTYSLRGSCSTTTFTLNSFLVISVSTSGTTVNSTHTGVTEIWGIK